MMLPNFTIHNNGPVSKAFLDKDIHSFYGAIKHIQQLPYKRNSNKDDHTTVLTDACGTCGSKHAALQQLADEHHIDGLQLITGMYRMHEGNTKGVGATLAKHGLDYIPEAHNYLMYKDERHDFTSLHSKPSEIFADLLEETVITPQQISGYKVDYHKKFLTQWLTDNPQHKYTLDELWVIREQCIADLAAHRATKS